MKPIDTQSASIFNIFGVGYDDSLLLITSGIIIPIIIHTVFQLLQKTGNTMSIILMANTKVLKVQED
ncbi:hypothetical protein QD47_23320 [Paenibacillus terrae]|uniref:Uncharacterized protein n=1 Tax=Paenibacillus terrae TaxID=159743 RepID=A0A0D7WX46_9BACL|nr:hypothetical protein QD47_23320 [Paenibacillus terrae]